MPINVLIYKGRGVSAEALHQTIHSLRSTIGRSHTINTIDAASLARDPWETECALLVIPGGRDIPYMEDISSSAIQRIKQWIYGGNGRILGICAGAYFCCHQISFEPNNPQLSIEGSRDLSLCPCVARGTLNGTFKYDSEEGSQAAPIKTNYAEEMKVYYNGGCWFDFSLDINSTLRYTNLATYADNNKPAVVAGYLPDQSKASVILSGVHLEYEVSEFIKRNPTHRLCDQLTPFGSIIDGFWKRILQLFGITVATCDKVDEEGSRYPPLRIHFKSQKQLNTCLNLLSLKGKPFECEEDKFFICDTNSAEVTNENNTLQVILMNESANEKETFKTKEFFSLLKDESVFGGLLIHTPSIGSTQSLLQNNPSFTSILPSGTVLIADEQTKGRGRGNNTWLSSTGCLQFTVILHHFNSLNVVLVQYLAALSMIEAVLSIPQYASLPLKLKWPNDLYSEWDGELRKLGGVLVTSQVTGSAFCLLVGVGFNIHDTPWTRSLNDLVADYNSKYGTSMTPLNREIVLSAFCRKFSSLYAEMQQQENGFPFELYYSRWMHSGQVVTLAESGEKVRILGIDSNGYLEVKTHDEGLLGLLSRSSAPPYARTMLLQPDGNSFDMMANLIKRKQ